MCKPCFPFIGGVGVSLGYSVEDVMGFMENKGENFKLCGTWKVYGNVENAKRTFSNYVKCRAYLCNKINEGAEMLEEDVFEPFLSAIEGSLNGKKVALFGSYGWGYGERMINWEERVKADGSVLVNGEGVIANETP